MERLRKAARKMAQWVESVAEQYTLHASSPRREVGGLLVHNHTSNAMMKLIVLTNKISVQTNLEDDNNVSKSIKLYPILVGLIYNTL